MTALKIVKSDLAKQDLLEKAGYYAVQNGVDLSDRFLTSVENAFELLPHNPGVGVMRSYKNNRLRVWAVPNFEKHLIFYRVTEKTVDIIRILHGARDLPQILSEPQE